MISSRAQGAMQEIFCNAARSRLVLNADDHCDIRIITPGDTGMPGECNAYVLTISSMQFRMLLILRASLDEATQQYYLRNQPEKTFEEVFLEITNLCCGAINQELIRYFPDLGMSTPYRLSNQCMRFIDFLKPAYLSNHSVAINDAVRLSATICVCAHVPVDFAYEAGIADVESGELEMF